MYASLHARGSNLTKVLCEVVERFSPEYELCGYGQTATFSISPLRQMLGSPHQIASEIGYAGQDLQLTASLALAANPDTAILLARYFRGVTLVTPGDERLKLAPIPLAALFEYEPVKLPPSLLEILLRWGVKTCEDLAALPEKGIAERLGTSGVYLRNLACGQLARPLRLQRERTCYEVRQELEHSLSLLEPLLFLLSRAAGELCQVLRSQGQAARELALELNLDPPVTDEEAAASFPPAATNTYRCQLEFPIPLTDPRTMVKLLQLHLERHAPGASVRAFRLHLEPTDPKRVQGGIFLPQTPAADKLQLTLTRIASLVGAENVGTPVLLNSHRPDAFATQLLPEQDRSGTSMRANDGQMKPEMLRLAMRLFRPALPARVQVVQWMPKKILAAGVRGQVTRSAGPWKTAGEWWAQTAWSREEWDVALDDGALYRIYQESASREWYVHGIYD